MRRVFIPLIAALLALQSCNDKNFQGGMPSTQNRNSGDFTEAARIVTPTVVHINTFAEKAQPNLLEELFRGHMEREQRPREEGQGQENLTLAGSGSGVIITSDGFIVTSYHIIENAERIEVTLNDKRFYVAEVAGIDPVTDLALLKIKEKNLPFVEFGNVDDLQVGEWIAAVGNPFNLTSTVTAGIVSAKGRQINILEGENGRAIESFIQTDAALNPGNSGGALVNMRGLLIGVNAAIASPTGVFAGYSFAVPVNIVEKVVKDIREFGEVRRGLLGVNIRDINPQLAEEAKLDDLSGAYVESVVAGTPAEKLGLQKGDVIIEFEGREINTAGELQEMVSLKRPGEEISITYRRNGKEVETETKLMN
jgi:serine protease Do